MSGNKQSYLLSCVARAATLQDAPSRLRLSVREPRRGCLPWFPKKHTVATLSFKEAHWQQGASGEYEQTAKCEIENLAKLRHLAADLPVKVKYWTKGRPSKVLLQASLGALLDQLEGSPASEAWLAFTATGQELRVCLHSAEHQDGIGADHPLSHDGLGHFSDLPLEYDDLWDSGGEEIPVEEDLPPETPAPCVTKDGEDADGEWVAFFNPSTGKTLRLPRHTKKEAAERRWTPWTWTEEDPEARWRGPGAWTSEDDLLSLRALRIVEHIQPVVKRVRLPEGPQWWEQATDGNTAAAAVTHPAERGAGQIPPGWNLPVFPGCSDAPRRCGETEAGLPDVTLSAPCRRGEADTGLPEVPLSAPRRRGEAARGSTGRRRPFLTVVAALAYMIFVPWLVTQGDHILYAICERVDGWVRMWLSG